jgi:ribosome biogenesis GTPase / thiamine phosphate phosphatase
VLAVSSRSGEGLDSLLHWLVPHQTVVLLGSSGAGKSTLVNALAGGDVMATGAIRESDGRGRHTTSHRELVVLPNGCLMLDTPGMREIGLADGAEGVKDSFADLVELATRCQFADCRHGTEPHCAVRAALEDGAIDPDRLDAWRKLDRETSHDRRRADPVAKAAHKKRSVAMQKSFHAHNRNRDDD